MKKVIIITGNHLRHRYFRLRLATSPQITVLRSYCEETRTSTFVTNAQKEPILAEHLALRDRSEEEFFADYCLQTEDHSKPIVIPKGQINEPAYIEEIKKLKPDLILTYGCSIIRPELIDAFPMQIINVHLGLSPYYRGSGTNYFPFVNDEPMFCGVTFMYIDAGIDTGEIIHQMRAKVKASDDIHSIGNRLIYDMANELALLLERYPQQDWRYPEGKTLYAGEPRRLYKNADFTTDTLVKMKANFASGMLTRYLEQEAELHNAYPIKQVIL